MLGKYIYNVRGQSACGSLWPYSFPDSGSHSILAILAVSSFGGFFIHPFLHCLNVCPFVPHLMQRPLEWRRSRSSWLTKLGESSRVNFFLVVVLVTVVLVTFFVRAVSFVQVARSASFSQRILSIFCAMEIISSRSRGCLSCSASLVLT